MQHQRLGEHGQLRRTKFIFPVMANNKVFNQDLKLRGKVGHLSEFGLQHFQLDNHVPQQLSARRVRKGAVIGELVNLTDVMQERTGKQQITIDLGIIAAQQIARTKKRDHVIEQSPNVSVMQSFGRGRVAIGFRNFRIRHECFYQRFEVGIAKSSDESRQRLPQFADVFGGLRQIIGEVNFRIAQAAKFVDGDLKAVLIFVEQPFDFEEVVLLEGIDCVLDVIPHFGVELAGAVTENERQIWLSGLLRLDLLGNDHESRSDDLIFVVAAIG